MSKSQTNETHFAEENDALNEIRKNNLNHVKVAPLNIKSIRNEFEMLKEVVVNKIGLLLISQTKLDDTFPLSQFILERYRLNR